MDDRFVAFKILKKIEKDNAYSNLTLDTYLTEYNESVYSGAFVSALVLGVTERLITLDYILAKHLKQPLKKLKPEVLTVLRMGAYQIKYMDSVPVSAAVNESVKLVKKSGCSYASGLVNSVLRRVSETQTEYPSTGNPVYDMSVKYSCSEALAESLTKDYGADAADGILESSLKKSPLTARVNTLITDVDTLIESLNACGVSAEKTQFPEYIYLKNTGNIATLEQYKNGLFHIQGLSSAHCVQALDVKPGMTVIDLCAAPGGKSFSIAELMNNIGTVYAFDLYPQRVNLIKESSTRLHIDIIKAEAHDAAEYLPTYEGTADRVLCDVPCSCLGTLSGKPEIKYKDLSFIDKLSDLQYNILSNSSRYLKKDGLLVYSTCTLSKRENENVCDRFLSTHPSFEKKSDYKTLMPHIDNTDGFFIAVFGRKHD